MSRAPGPSWLTDALVRLWLVASVLAVVGYFAFVVWAVRSGCLCGAASAFCR